MGHQDKDAEKVRDAILVALLERLPRAIAHLEPDEMSHAKKPCWRYDSEGRVVVFTVEESGPLDRLRNAMGS